MGLLDNWISKKVDERADKFVDDEWEKYAAGKLPADASPELAAELKGYVKAGEPVPHDRAAAIKAEIGDDAYASFEKTRSAVEDFDKADHALETLDKVSSGLKKIGL